MAMKNGIEDRETAKGVKRYRGVVKVDGQLQRGPWGSHADARSWRSKALGEIQAGTMLKPSTMTLREAWDEWLSGAKAGTIRNSSGAEFKPGTVRTYEAAWSKLDADFGAHKLSDIRRPHLQKWIEDFAQRPQQRKNRKPDDPPLYPSASSVRNAIEPLRAIYRRAVHMERVSIDPTTGLQMPKPGKRRERICTPEEARALLGTLPDDLRPIWATAFYGGLRLGELLALRWDHVDLSGKVIHVQRAWDDKEGDQEPKSKAAVRKVPVIDLLAVELEAQRERTGRSGADLVFGRTEADPFSKMGNYSRTRTLWKDDPDPPTLHDARHTFASYMIAAGCNAKALSVVMGHASIGITFDTYGHLMPGGEQEVGRLLGAYLAATPGEVIEEQPR